ncbi:MAG: DUF6782 family putative metallopeptidase [Pseudomonadota bacterium]|nr:DUF6782 family putative metallopeptidase [Pseudomonadota bacterium]
MDPQDGDMLARKRLLTRLRSCRTAGGLANWAAATGVDVMIVDPGNDMPSGGEMDEQGRVRIWINSRLPDGLQLRQAVLMLRRVWQDQVLEGFDPARMSLRDLIFCERILSADAAGFAVTTLSELGLLGDSSPYLSDLEREDAPRDMYDVAFASLGTRPDEEGIVKSLRATFHVWRSDPARVAFSDYTFANVIEAHLSQIVTTQSREGVRLLTSDMPRALCRLIRNTPYLPPGEADRALRAVRGLEIHEVVAERLKRIRIAMAEMSDNGPVDTGSSPPRLRLIHGGLKNGPV